jgi:hypothetical protein
MYVARTTTWSDINANDTAGSFVWGLCAYRMRYCGAVDYYVFRPSFRA